MSLTLPKLVATAFGQGCEASIPDLARVFSISLTDHPFDISKQTDAKLAEIGLQMQPPYFRGTFETRRLICSISGGMSVDELRLEIQGGEGSALEFKSSFMFHVDRAKSGKYESISELKSQDVMHSSMKTIAALMNAEGGVLLVGVTDTGAPHGIECDFDLMSNGNRDVDGWELAFRQHVQTEFYDGKIVNNFIRFSFFTLDELTVARVQVSARERCSYLKNKKTSAFDFYVRQGNRTVSLTLPEFEEYLRARR